MKTIFFQNEASIFKLSNLQIVKLISDETISRFNASCVGTRSN
jgi:hypothetical protein